MILITVNNEKYLMGNEAHDNVVGFFPEQFQMPFEQIKIELIPDDAKHFLNNVENARLDFTLSGFVKKVKIITEASETQEEVTEVVGSTMPLKKLKKWPYDENGIFLGNEWE